MPKREVFGSILFTVEDDDDSIEAVYYYDDDSSTSPTSESSVSSSSNLSNSSLSPYSNEKPKLKLRQSISNVLSPVRRMTQNPIGSPVQKLKSMRKGLLKRRLSKHSSVKAKSKLSWQEELDLPEDTTQDQAMAILLCRELESMDI